MAHVNIAPQKEAKTMRDASKAMPYILWCWPTTSKADVGGMAEEVELSYQYSFIFCCRVTDGSGGTI